MKKIVLILLIILQGSFLHSQANVNISNWPLFDGEQYLAVNPVNQNNIIVSWMQMKSNLKIAIAVKATTDGGVTWSETNVLNNLYNNYTAADPSISFNRYGIAYLCYVSYAGEGTQDSGAVVLRKSTDGGISWGSLIVARDINESSDLAIDRPWVAVDNSMGVNEGIIYITSMPPKWAPSSNQYLHLKYSTNEGSNWSGDIHVSASGYPGFHNSMGVMSVSKNGILYIAYLSLNGTNPSLALAITSNKGISFSRTHAKNWYGLDDSLYQNSYNITTDPQDGQNLNICFVNKINSDPDIYSIRSTNGGINWNSPVRVNKDQINNGIGQDMCWSEWRYGKLGVAYRDRRNFSPGSTSNFDVYISLSSDGGNTFYKEEKVSQSASQFNQYGYRGNDFLGFGLSQNYLNVCWSGYVSGINWDIFFSRNSVTSINTYSNEIPQQYNIYQNYPNPFNPMTTIEYDVPQKANLSIRVYDISGKEVSLLLNSSMNSGKYSVTFDGEGLASGIYFLKMSVNNGRSFIGVRRMVLLK